MKTAPLAAILLAASAAIAATSDKAAPEDPADSAKRTGEILAAIEKGEGKKSDQLARIDDLVTISPTAVNALVAFLKRDRTTDINARRKMLTGVGADVPNAKGRFRSPGRESKEKKQKADEFDWATNLIEKGRGTAAAREALADVAAIRALARSEDPRGALAALDFSFTPTGLIYRDEVGRYLRKGSPWSIPGLVRGAYGDGAEKRRYATYQLERIDRQAPHKALRAAEISEALQIELFRAFSDTLYREAVYAVLDNVDHNVETIRAAARATLETFVTKDPLRPPPRRRLSLPGGNYTKVRTALYLSHKELAEIELRKRLEALTGSAPGEQVSLQDLAKAYFAHYDSQRTDKLTAAFDAGRKAFAAGDSATAMARFDEILAQQPDHPKRSEMVPVYLAHGLAMLEAKDNQAAVVALTKAHTLDPEGPSAKEAKAKAHIARARLIDAAGGDSSAEMARAVEADPDAGGSGPRWMLFLGVGGGLAGIFLLLAGAMVRRRR